MYITIPIDWIRGNELSKKFLDETTVKVTPVCNPQKMFRKRSSVKVTIDNC